MCKHINTVWSMMFGCKMHFLKRELFLFVSDGVARTVLLEAYKQHEEIVYDTRWLHLTLSQTSEGGAESHWEEGYSKQTMGFSVDRIQMLQLESSGWRGWWYGHLRTFTTDSNVEEMLSIGSPWYILPDIWDRQNTQYRKAIHHICVSSRNWCDTWCNKTTFLNKIQYIKIYYYEMENNLWTLLGSYILHKCVSQLKIYTFSFHFQLLFPQISEFDSSKIEQI